MTDTTLKTALQAVSAQVEAAMRADLDQRLASSDPLLREILDYALFGGGKRVRPFLCVQAARCCGRLFLLQLARFDRRVGPQVFYRDLKIVLVNDASCRLGASGDEQL